MSLGTPANISFVDTSSATTTWDISYTSTGSGRHLIAITSARQESGFPDKTLTSFTYSGSALTDGGGTNGTQTSSGTAELWFKKDPASGANTLARTFAAAPNFGDASSVTFEITGGADTIAGAAVSGDFTNTESPTINITTTAANSTIVLIIVHNLSFTAWTNSVLNIYSDGVVNRLGGGSIVVGYRAVTTATTYTVGATFSTASADGTLFAVELLESGGGSEINIAPVLGWLELQGQTPVVRNQRPIAPLLGTFLFGGNEGQVVSGGNEINISPLSGALLFNGSPVAARNTRIIGPLEGSLLFGGGAGATPGSSVNIPGVLGALSFQGGLGVVRNTRLIGPLAGSLLFEGGGGATPASGKNIPPLTGVLDFGGGVGDIRLTKTVAPEAGTLNFDGGLGLAFDPDVTVIIEPLKGTLRFDGGLVDISTFRWSRIVESDTLWTPVA